MKKSLELSKFSDEYTIKNKIIGHINSAAGWHAIERGYGATILGSGEGSSSPLSSKFIEVGVKGDAEAFQAEMYINELLNIKDDMILENKLNSWHEVYKDLLDKRPKILNNEMGRDEWFKVTTLNINNEFDLRNIIFTSEKMDERIIYMSNILGPNVSRLCEFAGLERALIGNTIASGEPISEETYSEIKRYRAIVEQSLDQILLLKDLLSTSDKMKQAILEFEREFLHSFQLLREDVFEASRKVENEKTMSLTQMNKIKMDFRNYLSGVYKDILNISKQESVIALAKSLRTGNDKHLSEQKKSLEAFFKFFSQVKMIYDQIRFIDNYGHERVRVDFDGTTAKEVIQPMLQDKSKRYYFKESINMPQGSVYISRFDLNIEQGKIEIPYKPVIRFVTPVFVDGKQAGIVVFNVITNADGSILSYKAMESKGKDGYILADQNGYYLHHPDDVKEWGMIELFNKTHHNIRQDYPDVAEQVLSGRKGMARSAAGTVVIYEPFFPDLETDADKFWVIINRIARVNYPVNAQAWFDAATRAINTGLAISEITDAETKAFMSGMRSDAKRNLQINLFILAFVVMAFLFFIRWSRTRILIPIQKLTSTSQRIAGGEYSIKAEVKSNDEIGLLTTNFNKMAEGLTNEINVRKYAEKLLRKSEEEYRLLVESAQDAIICINEKGIIYIWNKLAEKIFGYSKSEVIGQSVTIIIPENYKPLHQKGFNRFLETGIGKIIGKSIDVLGRTKAGAEIPIELSLSFYKTEEGQYLFIGILRDLSERKRIEELLVRSEKMKSMGMITSGVAHEFNNILAIVKGFALQIQKQCGDNKKLKKRIDTILNASNDGVKIVSRMKEFTNREIMDSSQFVPTDMRALVEQAIEFTMPRWYSMAHAKGITYIMNTQDLNKVVNVLGNETELREVLINIINNALDAMPGGGGICFRSGGVGDTVFIVISDTGVGMSKDVQKKIFDPFFSTKQFEGTGLGLSASYGIIAKHGGRIDVESEVGKGCTFTIFLPMTTESVRQEVITVPVPKIMSENLRILIVDDQKSICDVLSDFFIKDGHNVKSVFSGTDAIKLLKTEEFDLVLSDIVMPEVSGYDVIRAVYELENRPKIGIITGWLNTGHFENDGVLKADFISRKPFDFAELTESINKVMGKYLSDGKEIIGIDSQLSDKNF
jgi:PAS domain S-box-containing protein